MAIFVDFIILSGLLAGITNPSAVVLDGDIADNGVPIIEPANKWAKHSVFVSLSQNLAVLNYENYIILEKGEVVVTAYSSTIDQTDDTPFIMASGEYVYDGAIAANFLPFGVKVRFPDLYDDKIFTVEDRMNKKYDNRMDIWMETRHEAKNFGIKKLKYEIIEKSGVKISAFAE